MTNPAGGIPAATTSAAAVSLGAAQSLAVPSAAAYRRNWQLFADWCAATGHQALPATADTVTDFARAAGSAPSTERRFRAAIADAHRRAGHVPPGVPVAQRSHPFPGVDVQAVLGRIPVWGWPAGLFGRRDAMLVVARVQAGLTLAQTAALTVEQVSVDENQVLHLPGVQLTPTEIPQTCPACVWLRWRSMLVHMRRFTPAAVLARRLYRSDVVEEHRCASTSTQQVSGPVLVPINQWGAPPLPLQPATARTITALTTAHTGSAPPRHPTRTPPPEDPPPPPALSASPAVHGPVDVRTPAQIHSDGLAARHRDHTTLQDLTVDFDALEAATAHLQRRVDELLRQTDNT